MPDIGFASCANDRWVSLASHLSIMSTCLLRSEIRIWTTEGDLVYTLSGHTSFIYSLSVLPTGEIVSAGEDRTVRIWRGMPISVMFCHP